MGDVGIATESDANDTHWNIAKMVNNKKSIGAHFVDKVTMNEDFQQEFALLVNYVAFKFTKEKGDVFELSKACTIVASAQVGFNHCIYNELPEYVVLHESSLNVNALCNITKSYNIHFKKSKAPTNTLKCIVWMRSKNLKT